MGGTRRRGRAAGAATALVPVLLLAACGSAPAPPPPPSCSVRVPGADGVAGLELEPSQAANAATIAAVGRRLGLPDHAVTVALATAMQESKLRNLPYGDRDSLGLFQQRPSQGWGSAEQVSDPAYAAAAFYRHLTAVPGWADLPVSAAAQAVQHSGYPDAYGRHEDDARLLARATTGQVPAALACAHLAQLQGLQGVDLAREATTDLGPTGLQPADDGALWSAATWLVAHASAYGVTRVTAAGRTWTASAGTWAAPGADGGSRRLSWS